MCIYLLFNTVGFNVYAHFCGTALMKVDFFAEKKTCCDLKKQKKNCCSTEIKSIYFKGHYVNIAFTKAPTTASLALFSLKAPEALVLLPKASIEFKPIHSPPNILLFAQNFRI